MLITDAAGIKTLQILSGSDRISAGDENDVVSGGAGTDVIERGAGDDRLYAGAEIDLAEAIAQGLGQQASDVMGEWLNGGGGNDMVVSGADNEVLYGGGGNGILGGGAGNDFLNGDDDYTADAFGWTFIDRNNELDWQSTPVTV